MTMSVRVFVFVYMRVCVHTCLSVTKGSVQSMVSDSGR